MKAKSSAHYQREFRKRLREQGLVKKEVWILPENAKALSGLEKQLRLPAYDEKGVSDMSETIKSWDTAALYAALKEAELIASGGASIELIDGVEASLHVVMHEFGDLPIFLTVCGEQIIAEAVLWSLSEVRDVAAFHEAVLRTHKYFPLSTISLDSVAGEGDFYHMFGSLSSTSILPNVLFEIEVLASNVIQATEAYSEFLSIPVAASE